jgi:hypothetical protein
VSGDKGVRELGSYEGIRIVTPAEFLAILAIDDAEKRKRSG